jgi:predicted dehydrogenase
MHMVLKAGVVGLGILGSQYTTFLDEQPETQVVGVADIRSEVAREVGAPVGAESYDDYERMFQEQTLDLAVVATPDPLHRDPVMAAIEAGVPVVIQEKPMATTVDDAEAMLEAAEGEDAWIFVNYANRGAALDRATYYVIREGLLGEVVYGEIHLDDNISVPRQLWGDRSEDWAAGSSTAYFLLSHVVDLLHWVMAPSEVTEVYAISQQRVLGYTPDLYDAFLTFDNGAKFRVKAEWIKHIDGLVEFALDFSGSEGTLRYIKYPGFGEAEGWRANLSESVTAEALLKHQNTLAEQDIDVRAQVQMGESTAAGVAAAEIGPQVSLEAEALPKDEWRVVRGFVDAVLEDTLTPSSWQGYGPLPTGIDGLRQTQVVSAIVQSAEEDRVITLP